MVKRMVQGAKKMKNAEWDKKIAENNKENKKKMVNEVRRGRFRGNFQ